MLAARAKPASLPEPSSRESSQKSGSTSVASASFRRSSCDWPAAVPTSFVVEISSDGQAFTTVRRVEHGGARRAWLHLPETEARIVRLVLPPGDLGIAPRRAAARRLGPDGDRPRLATRDGGAARSSSRARSRRADVLDGRRRRRRHRGGPRRARTARSSRGRDPSRSSRSSSRSGKLVTWADAAISHSLERGDLPIPTVTWRAGPVSLDVTALVDGSAGASVLRARYRVRNERDVPSKVKLFVALRPFLVNPPTQFLNAPHGVARIDALSFRDGTSDRERHETDPGRPGPVRFRDRCVRRGADFGFSSERGKCRAAHEIRDETGLASGALAWDLEIPSRAAPRTSFSTCPCMRAGAPIPDPFQERSSTTVWPRHPRRGEGPSTASSSAFLLQQNLSSPP